METDPEGDPSAQIAAGPVLAPLAVAGAAASPSVPAAAIAAASPVSAAARPPRVGETVGGSFDLALAASARVRRASIYIGILTLALAGPAAILFLALIRDVGSDDLARLFTGEMTLRSSDPTATSLLGLAIVLGGIGVTLAFIEGQIMATAIVGGAATGRRIGLRRSLRLSRRVFWSVCIGGFLVGIVDRVVSVATMTVVGRSTGDSELATIVTVAAAGLATLPFGFYQAGIILGGVGAWESVRRSVRIARARWRLALLVALAGIVLGYIELFALGAGLDLVFRVAGAAGLGIDKSVPIATLTVVLILFCIVAVGSLIVTIAALVAAPQVFVFVKMTGYSAGLDRAMEAAGDAPPSRPRLITWPMLAVIVLGIVTALVGLAST